MSFTSINDIKFGEIVFADLPMDGSVQGGPRPVLVVQNDKGNQYSSTVEVLPLSSRIRKASYMPTHVYLEPNEMNGLRRDSIIIAENVLTIPKARIQMHIGYIDALIMKEVGKARHIQSPLPF